MVVYPNQKVVTVRKTEEHKILQNKKREQFLQISNTGWQSACDDLTYSAFKLFLYFASNKDGYSFALSYEAVNDVIPMHRNTYDKAIAELINKGYLTKEKLRDNIWYFDVYRV